MEQNFEQSIPISYVIIGFIFLSVLSYFVKTKLRARKLAQEGQVFNQDGSIPSIEARLVANKEWASGKIKSKGKYLFAALWLLALVWNLTFGVSFFKSFSNPQIKLAATIFLGLFSLAGPVIIYFAIRETLRRFRYGNSFCMINGKAGVLGKVIEGRIFSSTNIKATGDYTVSLECIEHYYEGTGKNRTSKTKIHWQSKTSLPFANQDMNAGIYFKFELPKYPPETGYQLARGDIDWHLRISAPTAGVDYYSVFIVPVFKME